ncbi:MAG: hypothetical protein NUW00_00120 [Candidatus Kaiserbacteria bacterium]|nr:hypothetical protein [Candidatus Kaiserbacteria bacterium]
MISKTQEREQAIVLRKSGKTYAEILSTIPVSKSTLSLWLRSVNLSTKQKQRITAKKQASQLKGAQARRSTRIAETQRIFASSKETLGTFSSRDLFILGIGLYWAEGTKEKVYRPSVPIEFANSDPKMITLFMKWLRKCIYVPDTDIQLILHIHQNRQNDISNFKKFWMQTTGLSEQNFGSNVIKRHNPKTKRKNTGDTYKGLLAIRVKRSTMLNRRIQGWIYGIIDSAQP